MMRKILEQVEQMGYIPCSVANHEHSPLNIVCADHQCDKCSLLCIHCQLESHENHQTIHLKHYLRKLLLSSKVELEQQNLLRWAENLDKSRSEHVAYWKSFKEKMDDMIDGLIFDIEKKYQEYCEQIKNITWIGKRVENFIKLYQQMAEGCIKSSQQQQKFKSANSNISKSLLSILKYAKIQTIPTAQTDLSSNQHQQKSYKITSLQNQIKILSMDFSQKCRSILKQLKKSQQQICITSLNKIYDILNQKVETINILKSTKFSWSQNLKTSAISINGLIAERKTGVAAERFALFSQELRPYIHGRRKACWVMKIIKLVGWIGLGICIKSKILESGYKFHYENLGHGSYMISSNGYSWSSSVKTHNSAYFSGFSFGAGDFVIVQLEAEPAWKLNFYVLKQAVLIQKAKLNNMIVGSVVKVPAKALAAYKDTKDQLPLCLNLANLQKSHTLDLEYSLDYTPCVNLCSTGDSVEIVN